MFDWEVFDKVSPGRRAWLEDKSRRANRKALSVMQKDGYVWYVAVVNSQKEFVVQRILGLRKIPAFVRYQRKWRRINRYSRNKARITYPLMPGYLFVGFKAGQERWHELFRHRSVHGVVGVDGEPMWIPSHHLYAFITGDKSCFEAPKEQQFMRTHHEFAVGDRVQIVEGPFEDHIVDVKDIRGSNAHILMNFLGNIQNVEISLDKLEKAA